MGRYRDGKGHVWHKEIGGGGTPSRRTEDTEGGVRPFEPWSDEEEGESETGCPETGFGWNPETRPRVERKRCSELRTIESVTGRRTE